MSSPRRKILAIVDDSPVILKAARDILKDAYDVFTMMSGVKLFQFLELSQQLPDMILLDVVMPPPDGYAVIEGLKKDARFADIPVIFLTSKSGVESEIKGLSLGAVDYIAKPFSPPLLLMRLELQLKLLEQQQELKYLNRNLNRLVNDKVRTIFGLQRTILTTIGDLVEFRDDITGGHVERTGTMLQLFVTELRERGIHGDTLGGLDVTLLRESSKLHDVGKIAIRDSILLKPGRLTPEEFEEMKSHAGIGEDIIIRIQQESEESDFLNHAKIMAGAHHERWDGAGYPRQLSGGDIPLLGRLMAFADVYDALISKRPYKEALPHEQVLDIMNKESGRQFDPSLMDAFIASADRFHQQFSKVGRTG
ncbi:MAG: response regulator [Deltaproteobacteria bacterium]|jgi:putative two-component system response regulator|nr:response regulator [Deltaproteobacteria bacterium]